MKVCKLLIKEFRDVDDPRDVTFGVLPDNTYEIDDSLLDEEAADVELHRIHRAMIANVIKHNWDWVQFYHIDRKYLLHGTVI